MEHGLISTIVACIVGAFIFGLIAKGLKLPTILGYLLAGVAVGPYTPGIVADPALATQLAEIGIMLLMFGVGMHFSIHDLLNVRRIALPGAVFQMGAATVMGAFLIWLMGIPWSTALLFGFSLSVASTVVMLRALEQRKLVDSDIGKIAIGWLIVEDIAMVLAIVMLPVYADIMLRSGEISPMMITQEVAMVIGKISLFAVSMVVIGRRALPPLLTYVAKTKSHELSALATLAIAIGFAYIAYEVFDASFALGAFLAGLVLNESKIGHKFAEQSLPMRDIFSVLFFVSVGMLFDPNTLVKYPLQILATVVVIVVGKSLAAILIMRLFRQPNSATVVIAASLAQIGEFSFIFANMAMALDLMSRDLFNLIVAGALISITLNHFIFKAIDRIELRKTAH